MRPENCVRPRPAPFCEMGGVSVCGMSGGYLPPIIFFVAEVTSLTHLANFTLPNLSASPGRDILYALSTVSASHASSIAVYSLGLLTWMGCKHI